MSSFFMQMVKERLDQNKDKYPLLKINDLLDWSQISDLLEQTKRSQLTHRNGKPGYPLLKLFKAILLGQWHSLSDPELERSLAIRGDFLVFCDFDDMELPDETTLNRFRNWLIRSGQLNVLLSMVNDQLTERGLKIKEASQALVDASIIDSRGRARKKGFDVSGDEVKISPSSADKEASWVKRGSQFHLGYKLHARVDREGYFDCLKVTRAHEHETHHLESVLTGLSSKTRVMTDKGYDSQSNRDALKRHDLKDGIMKKAKRNRPLSHWQKRYNSLLKQHRYVVEQSFGTLKRRFHFSKASYFTQERVYGQSVLKAMCVNLLKAANKLEYV